MNDPVDWKTYEQRITIPTGAIDPVELSVMALRNARDEQRTRDYLSKSLWGPALVDQHGKNLTM
jgi:hypothetical protein